MGKLYEESLKFNNNWKDYSEDIVSDKKLSVVIPVYHPQHLDTVLNHLSKLGGIEEVVLVFDGPDDECESIIKKYNFDLLVVRHDQNYNAPATNNTGSTFASGDILLFLDQDMILSPSFIPKMKKLLAANNNHGIVLGFRDTVEFEELPDFENWKEANYMNDWRMKTYSTENLLDLTITDCGNAYNNCSLNQELKIFEDSNKFRNLGTKEEKTIGYWDLPSMVVAHTLAISKKDFYDIGGFPEWIIGWGGEDTALGFLATAHHIPIMALEVGSYQIKHPPLSGSEEQKWKEMSENLKKYKQWVKELNDFPIIDRNKVISRSKIICQINRG